MQDMFLRQSGNFETQPPPFSRKQESGGWA